MCEHRVSGPSRIVKPVFGIRCSVFGRAFPKTERRAPITDSGWRRGGGQRFTSEMAGGELTRLVLDERRNHLAADRKLCDRTTCVKDASARRIERRRNVAGEDDAAL